MPARMRNFIFIILAFIANPLLGGENYIATLTTTLDSHIGELRALQNEPNSPLHLLPVEHSMSKLIQQWINDEIKLTEARLREVQSWRRRPPEPQPSWLPGLEYRLPAWENSLSELIEVERQVLSWQRLLEKARQNSAASPPDGLMSEIFQSAVNQGQRYRDLLSSQIAALTTRDPSPEEMDNLALYREVRWEWLTSLVLELHHWRQVAAPAFTWPETGQHLRLLSESLNQDEDLTAQSEFTAVCDSLARWQQKAVREKSETFKAKLRQQAEAKGEGMQKLAALFSLIDAMVNSENQAIAASLQTLSTGMEQRYRRNLADWEETRSEKIAWQKQRELDQVLASHALNLGVPMLEIDFSRRDILDTHALEDGIGEDPAH